jgi:hypothetical protein
MDVNRVVDRVLHRADNPDPDREFAHLDRELRDIVDAHGKEAVVECVRLILDGSATHRQAGAVTFGNDGYLDGVTVRSVVSVVRHRSECTDCND